MGIRTLLLHSESDNVYTCLVTVQKGDSLEHNGLRIKAADDIPIYHKIAKVLIKAGDEVYKYGEPIGYASRDIAPGEHVHVHNLESARGRGDKQ